MRIHDAQHVWDHLAQQDPIHAAAAGSGDWFTKRPAWIDAQPISGVLLDAGCGYGRISIPLLERNPALQVIGVDASGEMLRNFEHLAGEKGVADRVRWVQTDLRQIPLDDASVDAALTSAVLLHNPKSVVREIVREIFRCVRPGGHVYFLGSFPNRWNPEGLESVLYSALYPTRNGPVRSWSRSEIRILLHRHADEVQIWSDRVTLLPRGLFSMTLAPYKRLASGVNGWITPGLRGLTNRIGLFAHSWEVIARKP